MLLRIGWGLIRKILDVINWCRGTKRDIRISLKRRKRKWTRKKMRQLATGNLEIWEEFYVEYGHYIFFWCSSLSDNDNDAWKLYQNVLSAVISSIRKCKNPRQILSFLFRIFQYVWLGQPEKKIREKKLREKYLPVLWADFRAGKVVPQDKAPDLVKVIWPLLDLLSDRQREVFLMYYCKKEPSSIQEIAEKLNIKPDIVNKHLSEAVMKLKESLRNLL